MNWQDIYKEKLVSVKQAAKLINSGDKIYMSGGMGAPVDLMEAITERANELENVDVVSGQLLLFLYYVLITRIYRTH